MTDDDPLDLAGVAADAEALERVRAGLVSGDDDALVLLHDLLLDVGVDADLPQLQPVGHGSTVLALAGEHVPDRRLARGGTVVAGLAAGLLALSGVAAAAGTLAPDGSALHGFGEAVRSAAGAVVGAVSPPASNRPGRAVPAASSPGPTARTAPPVRIAPAERQPTPGPVVAAASRSKAAARQVAQLLAAAEQLLADGRASAAASRLDLAERRLPDVLPADGAAALQDRLAALRARSGEPAPAEPKAKPAKPAPAQERDEPAKKSPAVRESEQRVEPRPAPSKTKTKAKTKADAGQRSKDASAKPRA
jgi:hypothetical protein